MKQIEIDVAVIGAGSAGLSAAYQAAVAGASVLVLDENHLPGGQLFKQIHKFFGSRAHLAGVRGYDIGQALLDKVEDSGAKVWLDAVVYGMQKDKSLGVIYQGQHYVVKAKKVVVATGAKENYLAFPGSTLPGVMGAGAAQTMINVNRVLPGKRVLMLGSGNVGLIVAYQLMQAGADVMGLVEAAPSIGGYGVHAGKIRRAGVPIYVGHTIKRVIGEKEVEAVELVAVDEKFQPIVGSEKTFEVDTVCLAVGLNPMTELLWMTGCEFTYIPMFGGHVPLHDERMETSIEGLYVAGDVTGVEEASSAMEEGNLAGVSVAHSLKLLTDKRTEELTNEIQSRLKTLRSGMFGEKRRASKEQQLDAMLEYQNKGGCKRWME